MQSVEEADRGVFLSKNILPLNSFLKNSPFPPWIIMDF